mgnify:CR=1 FL=1
MLKTIICFLLGTILYSNVSGQSTADMLSNTLFESYEHHHKEKRSVMKTPKKGIKKLNPLPYLATGAMYAYQRMISHQLQANCAYATTCSEYTKLSIEEFGILKGSLLGMYQLQSCFPHTHLNYPDYKISKNGEILNQVGLEK